MVAREEQAGAEVVENQVSGCVTRRLDCLQCASRELHRPLREPLVRGFPLRRVDNVISEGTLDSVGDCSGAARAQPLHLGHEWVA